MPKSMRFLSCFKLGKRKHFKGVDVLYTSKSFVSTFSTAKPSSLGLDHCRKGTL